MLIMYICKGSENIELFLILSQFLNFGKTTNHENKGENKGEKLKLITKILTIKIDYENFEKVVNFINNMTHEDFKNFFGIIKNNSLPNLLLKLLPNLDNIQINNDDLEKTEKMLSSLSSLTSKKTNLSFYKKSNSVKKSVKKKSNKKKTSK